MFLRYVELGPCCYSQKVRFFCVSFALDQGVLQGRKPVSPYRRREGKGRALELAEARRDRVVARPFHRQRVHLGAD